ncbi:MAG: hypothetical protein CMJ27_07555 [Phycisphaerae bacterium]|nr:hypothetical protein [Phycisphaerae bacterium]OUX93527.1 MAG: hypothetical protein CBB77_08780 [Hyphomonas sp. TMED17]
MHLIGIGRELQTRVVAFPRDEHLLFDASEDTDVVPSIGSESLGARRLDHSADEPVHSSTSSSRSRPVQAWKASAR